MKKALQEYCNSLNIEYVGIAPKGPYRELADILQKRREKKQDTEFEEVCIAKRVEPRLTMEDVESIIVCLFPYSMDQDMVANVAKYSYALDYHTLIKEKLKKIGQFLEAKIPDFHYQPFVDTGPLVDRYVAYLAGLGFYGVNGHIICDKYGSYVVIGYILTNYSFPVDEPLGDSCMQCGRCRDSCPGKAILPDDTINPHKCRSYLTQKKGELTTEEIAIIRNGKLIFGCDICQDVCPHNQKIATTTMNEFREKIVSELSYEELSTVSNKEFMRRYKDRAFSWRGRKLLLRNFEYIKNRLL